MSNKDHEDLIDTWAFFAADVKTWNPFWHNYLFTLDDLKKRRPLEWQDKLAILFKPYKVQIGDGGAYYYKLAYGRIYLVKHVSTSGKTTKPGELTPPQKEIQP